MRKFFLAFAASAALLGCIFGFAACDTEELGSLEDLSRPYTGVYLCEELTLSGEDALESFEYIRLELKYGGDFTVGYKTKSGSAGALSGDYEMDTVKEEVTFRAKQGLRTVSRTYPVENGSILVEENFLGRLLYAKFKPE